MRIDTHAPLEENSKKNPPAQKTTKEGRRVYVWNIVKKETTAYQRQWK